MSLEIGAVTFDSTDPRALAAWWAKAVGGEVTLDMDGFYVAVSQGSGKPPMLAFQLVKDPTPGKNRLHLDTSTADRLAEVERLVGLGAKLVHTQDMPEFSWTTLADPDGNQFCVSDAH